MQALPEHDDVKISDIAKTINELIRESQRQVGDVVMFGGSTVPDNYLSCDGTAISRTDYKLLYSVVGTTFGPGDGTTTFNLPDFRGVFPKGAGTTSRAAGKDASGAYYSGTNGTYLQDKFQGHYHSNVFISNGTGGGSNSGANWGTTNNVPGVVVGSYVETPTQGINGPVRTGNSTEPQSLGINFIIKAR